MERSVELGLGPLDYDIIDDVATGSKLLKWAYEHRVPLVAFCGYRLLFPEDAFNHIKEVCAKLPMSLAKAPYRFPYAEISAAVKQAGAEIWTGAGFIEGLQAGVLEKAAAFGFSGVLTTRDAWNRWNK